MKKEYNSACELFLKCCERREQYYGIDNKYTQFARGKYAMSLIYLDDYQDNLVKARRLTEEALDFFIRHDDFAWEALMRRNLSEIARKEDE